MNQGSDLQVWNFKNLSESQLKNMFQAQKGFSMMNQIMLTNRHKFTQQELHMALQFVNRQLEMPSVFSEHGEFHPSQSIAQANILKF